jgi:UDPglucose 6-dehydrogenase
MKRCYGGIRPFLEPGLDDALKRNLGKNIEIPDSALDAAKKADIIFLCVGTPSRDDGSADLTYLFSAIDSVIPVLNDGKYRALVVKSTVPPGTTEREIVPYLQNIPGDFSVAVNPEFLREGHSWEDFIEPDRVVCGIMDDKSGEVLTNLYEPFNATVHLVTPSTAEYTKYVSNALLATLISYSNEMALIGETIGNIDVGSAFKILHEDKRWSGSGINHYIYPGCGYGGYCLPKDTQALAAQAKRNGVEPKILQDVIELNGNMPSVIAERIAKVVTPGETIGILGLSFKPESDDVRDAPAAKIITVLVASGHSICSGLHSLRTLIIRIYQSLLRSFGADGISRCQRGSANICISL